ncbi:hypothetical protein ACIBEJ_13470 [Nonomuraea sp. NPDC050790]|uniref:hypothetical protein n=1 Tax=Nonomuraea sp. NPDC050790 TaxID=3364371 RepID=UPI00379BFFEE
MPSSTSSSSGALAVTLAALSAGAGAVHFAAMGEHFALDWRHGVFFAAAGWAQLGWAAVILRRAGRGVLLAGIAGNAAIVALWGLSRTAGVPFGPGAGTPEPVGAPDVLATVLEIALVCCALALLDKTPRTQAIPTSPAPVSPLDSTAAHEAGAVPVRAVQEPVIPGGSRAGLVVAGVVAVAVGAVFLPVFGTHGHAVPVSPVDAAAGHQHQSPRQEAGGHAHGDQGPAVPPSEGERAAADLAVAAAKRELPKRWPTLAAAKKDGFFESIDTGGVVHLTKMDWIMDDRVLDPTHPEALVFYRKPAGGSILLGAMYIMPPGAQGPRIGGSLTHWHAHDDLCGLPGGGVAVLNADGTCPKGTSKIPATPEMLHVWVVDYPEGPFGDATAPALRTAITTLLAKGA